ncbi:MAG: nucleotide exchange factor GrpE [Culicoidibacterales bacterium]
MSIKNDEQEIMEENYEAEDAEEILAENDDILEEKSNTEAEIEALEFKISELENALLKEKAEVENFKRRMKQEYDTNLKFSSQSLIEKLLPILDGFDRALDSADKSDEKMAQFTKGFEMIQSLFTQILEQEGLSIIPSVGTQFDPYLHQAVLSDNIKRKADNEVLEELQKGYKLKDRVIRATMVKVNNK